MAAKTAAPTLNIPLRSKEEAAGAGPTCLATKTAKGVEAYRGREGREGREGRARIHIKLLGVAAMIISVTAVAGRLLTL